MSRVFSRIVTDYWLPADRDPLVSEVYAVIVDEGLRDDLSLSLLTVQGGPRVVTVRAEAAAALSLADDGSVDEVHLHEKIQRAGYALNGPDHLFYVPVARQRRLALLPTHDDTRRLTRADLAEFERFRSIAPGDDLDDAFVDIDHWLVYGAFVDGELAAAASAYPWQNTALADIGVITLPAFRGRGFGTRVVQAIAGDALSQGYEPQYRCQRDNEASIALATAAGFARFGDWDVVVSSSSEA